MTGFRPAASVALKADRDKITEVVCVWVGIEGVHDFLLCICI
jgi:hypothetical protein